MSLGLMTLAMGQINNTSWNIGMRRVNKILARERANGYQAYSTGQYSEMADIIVQDPDSLAPINSGFDVIIRVYEVTNYARPSEYIGKDKGERYLNNLLQYRAEKIMVVSYEENLRILGGVSYFTKHGIKVEIVGYQD